MEGVLGTQKKLDWCVIRQKKLNQVCDPKHVRLTSSSGSHMYQMTCTKKTLPLTCSENYQPHVFTKWIGVKQNVSTKMFKVFSSNDKHFLQISTIHDFLRLLKQKKSQGQVKDLISNILFFES